MIIPAYRAFGAALAIGIMEALAVIADEPVARVPFITSIVLVMAMPGAPAAQPRALIGGHLVSCLAGWLCLALLGPGETTSAFAVGLATLAMIVCGVLHPPAGLDAFLIASQGLPARWIVNPVLIGTGILAAYAWLWAEGERRVIHNLTARRPGAGRRLAREDK